MAPDNNHSGESEPGAGKPTARLVRLGLAVGVLAVLAGALFALPMLYTPPPPEDVTAALPVESPSSAEDRAPEPDPEPVADPQPENEVPQVEIPAEPVPFALTLPVDCAIDQDCFIQQYPDWDLTEERNDYRCGKQTYDGHDGTDIRVKDMHLMAKGVAVLAAAPGVVVGLRDGEDDAIVMTEERKAAIEGKECGNGVVIAHGNGWRTQYCHLRQNSIQVLENQPVRRGEPLGLIGSSGMSEFPHLEFIVRRGEDEVIDPFVGRQPDGTCGQETDPLWTEETVAQLPYHRGAIIGVGFADGPLDLIDAEAPKPAPGGDAPALVAYGHVINTEAGDFLEVTLDGPNGRIADNGGTLQENEARRLIFTGRRRAPDQQVWAPGRYVATVRIMRDGETVRMDQAVLDLEG